jgi:hypothetical protein
MQCRYVFCVVGVYMFVGAYHIPEVQNFDVKVHETTRKKIKTIIGTFWLPL